MRANVPRWRRGLQNRVWWIQFPTVCTIGVTSCLAAARSVSLRKWSFLCAVRKRQDEGIYVLAGTGFVKMNGCDRRTGAGLKSSVGYRHCDNLRECRGVQWMWRGGGNRMIRPLCKQFKRSAMSEPVKRLTPNVGSVVALRGGKSLLCKAKGRGLVAKQEDGMDDITKQPYAKWLEESIATISGILGE